MNEPSNWRSEESLAAALRRENTPALDGLDTRQLTIHLREHGAQKAFLCASGDVPPEEGVARARAWVGLDGQDYAARVTCEAPYAWREDETAWVARPGECPPPPPDLRVVAYDFGMKWNLARHLAGVGMAVTVVPAKTPAGDVLAMRPDGVFLSNGPADPAGLPYAVAAVRELLGRVPLMGVCLGHQLLGLALGGRTYRLPFGHHGGNHPVLETATGRTCITSQNHNYAVDADSLPAARATVTHVNLNDRSVEGLRVLDAPAFSVQFHPEAAPGPHDSFDLFARFRALIDTEW